ncbi:EAL domain-containing protein [Ferrimonas balearica]|uniref:EAL domain-containing protein n=1 Tax=Ferrimonas balearica TaxID=44012 RepID=UPI001C98F895|nr:GGDEF domain-containing protein [Ferrimonas balearica]MBY5920087.1 GGDEF domain-containing protein [Ferrimonas balearica]MBY5997228.1 GGDEF domain-containing protein [Ferrimonas balearica]
MLSTRTTLFCLIGLYLAASAALLMVGAHALHNEISDDRSELQMALDSALEAGADPEQIPRQLSQELPLAYAFIRDRNDATQTVFGRYQEPRHLFAPMLDLYSSNLTLESRWQDLDIRLQLDGDRYLSKATTVLIKPMLLVSIVLLLALLLVSWRSVRVKNHLWTLVNAIERLPSLELPSDLDRVSGQLRPVGKALFNARSQLKERMASLSKRHLHSQPILDPVSGIKTRAFFIEEMERPASTDLHHGHLILLRASALGQINERQGRNGGDRYLAEIGHLLKQYARKEKTGYGYRYGATDFILRLPDCDQDNARLLLKDLSMQLAELAKHHEVDNAGSLGAIAYHQSDRISQLLTNLDTAVSMAESMGAHGHYLMDSSLADLGLDSERWLTVIDDVLEQGRLHFIHQRIQSNRDDRPLFTEMLVRFQNVDGNPLPTEPLFSMAARYGKVSQLDKMVVSRLIRELSNDGDSIEAFSLNLANHSFNDVKFIHWLEHQLQDQPKLASRLVIEVSENSIQQNPTHATDIVRRLHRLGARICIDHFGTALTSFRYLQILKPDFVKLEPSLIRDIQDNHNNQFFIKMLMEIAVRLELKVIATHVESADEKVTLEQLKVHGLQGHHIAMPKPIHPIRA